MTSIVHTHNSDYVNPLTYSLRPGKAEKYLSMTISSGMISCITIPNILMVLRVELSSVFLHGKCIMTELLSQALFIILIVKIIWHRKSHIGKCYLNSFSFRARFSYSLSFRYPRKHLTLM